MHRTLYREGLVSPDIFTLPQEGVPSYATGQHTFGVIHDYDQKVLNDPKLSQCAGQVQNAIMPGATRSTFSWVSMYLMGASTADPDRAWNLMRFFGGKAKDGQYHVIKRWALQFGLGTPYTEVMDDPGGRGLVQELEGSRTLPASSCRIRRRAMSAKRFGTRTGTGT